MALLSGMKKSQQDYGMRLFLSDLLGPHLSSFSSSKLQAAYQYLEFVCAARLTDREVQSLRLRYWVRVTYREMGKQLGNVSGNRSRILLHNALRKLRHAVCMNAWLDFFGFWFSVQYKDEAPEVIRAWTEDGALIRYKEIRWGWTGWRYFGGDEREPRFRVVQVYPI